MYYERLLKLTEGEQMYKAASMEKVAFKKFLNRVAEGVTQAKDVVKGKAGELWDATTDLARRGKTRAGDLINQGKAKAGELWDATTDLASRGKTRAGELINQGKEKATDLFNAASDRTGSLFNRSGNMTPEEARKLGRNVLLGTGAGLGLGGLGAGTYAALKDDDRGNLFDALSDMD